MTRNKRITYIYRVIDLEKELIFDHISGTIYVGMIESETIEDETSIYYKLLKEDTSLSNYINLYPCEVELLELSAPIFSSQLLEKYIRCYDTNVHKNMKVCFNNNDTEESI